MNLRYRKTSTLNRIQDALPQEISAQFNAIFAKLIQDKFGPEAVAKAREQSRELLQAEYPQALERVEEMVFKNESQFTELHRHL
jgi:triphosphoribosyl-dephospho-CoA synthetase